MIGLLVLELLDTLGPVWNARIRAAQVAIWAVFVIAFAVELAFAPSKLTYLKRNWLIAVSVFLPAVRVFRVFRAFRVLRGVRAVRSLSLLRLVATLNRGTRALTLFLRKGQVAYLLSLTIIVTLTLAAGTYYLERNQPEASILSFPDALWWASTIVTTISSPLEPVTTEGRLLGILLRIFGVAVIGYLTAAIAVFLLGRPHKPESTASLEAEVLALRSEIAKLRAQLDAGVERATNTGR
jgi:voltage-gated potassium channel